MTQLLRAILDPFSVRLPGREVINLAQEKPDVRQEVAMIMEGVLKGLMSIPFPDQFSTSEGASEYITMHFCEKCKGYHKVKSQ